MSSGSKQNFGTNREHTGKSAAASGYSELGEYPYYGPFGDGFSMYAGAGHPPLRHLTVRHLVPEYMWWTPHAPNARQYEESKRGAFTEAYPNWYPYYPLGSYNPNWIDTWAMQGYQGYWWT